MTVITYYPIVENESQLADIISRASWFLSFVSIARIFVPVSSESLARTPWRVASGMDSSIPDTFELLRAKIEFVVAQQETDLEDCIGKADIILRWKKDTMPALVSVAVGNLLAKGDKVWDVDPVAIRMEGSIYIEISLLLLQNREELIRVNHDKFTRLADSLGKFKRAYLIATGPSVSRYKFYDYSDSISIVCNSVILDEELMRRVKPKILVFADPIFHFGPSQYAAEYRRKVRVSAKIHDFTICIPFKYYAIFSATMPDLLDRTIAIPFLKDVPFNFDLCDKFEVRSTANILTLLLNPLGTTFAEELCYLGCDGRPLKDNTYFWGHNPKTQINDKMANIREVHPGFFAIDYNEYYLEHCKMLEAQFFQGEKAGKHFISLGFSHIPALNSRIEVGARVLKKNIQPLKTVYIIDPDAKNFSGHYMAYNEKLSSQFRNMAVDVRVICRKDLDPEILALRAHYLPVLTAYSWDVANRAEREDFLLSFEVEIKMVLQEAFADRNTPILLYMYCGSAEHALILRRLCRLYPMLHVNINLFWFSFNFNYEIAQGWKSFFELSDSDLGDVKFVVTLPTETLRNEVAEYTSCILPVAPHPSTGISDEKFIELRQGKVTYEVNSMQIIRVLFPGSPRIEKGYLASIDCAKILANLTGYQPIIRHQVTFSTGHELAQLMVSMPVNVEIIEGDLSDEAFMQLFTQSDIVVLPYTPLAFSKRTSGLLIDSMYNCMPCVVIKGTWLEKNVEQYKFGIVVADASAIMLAEAVQKIAENYNYYYLRARHAKEVYFTKNSWKFFAQFLLASPKQNTGHLTKHPICTQSNISNLRSDGDFWQSDNVAKFGCPIRFLKVESSQEYATIEPKVWCFSPVDNIVHNFWFIAYKVTDGCHGREYVAGLKLTSSRDIDVRITLARFGETAYEAGALVVQIEACIEQTISLRHKFIDQHFAIKVQIEVISIDGVGTTNLKVDSVYLKEIDKPIRKGLPSTQASLVIANKYYRDRNYRNALVMYLQLYKQYPHFIYSNNILITARKLGINESVSIEELLQEIKQE
jgi:hypothetical protein